MEKLVTLKELADYLQIGYQTTRKLVMDGQISGIAFKRGRCTIWRFNLEQVLQQLSSKSA